MTSPQTTIAKKTLEVLIVEDDESDFFIIKNILNQIDSILFSVEWADTYNKAVEKIEKEKNNFDVILVDYQLGIATGTDLIMELKDVIHCPFIIMTSGGGFGSDREALESGAFDYLLKEDLNPFNLEKSIRYSMDRLDSEEEIKKAYSELEKAHEKLERVNSKLEKTVSKLEDLVEQDALTELLNRRGFEKALMHETRRSRRGGYSPVAIFIDLDDFKNINEIFGHGVGDVVLKEVANKIADSLRPIDHAARIGGDEFMVILTNTRLGEARHIAERLRLMLAESPIQLSSGVVNVTASMGLSVVDSDILSIDVLLQQLRDPMQASKKKGKNRISQEGFTASSSDMTSDVLGQLKTGKGLRATHQKILELANNTINAYEVLCRGPQGAFESPDAFFRLSTENEILTEVDLNCLKKALQSSENLENNAIVNINIFPSTIISSTVGKLTDLLQPYRHKICLEISEQQIIGDPSYLSQAIKKFKAAGVMIALDDVGFGRSCFESLIVLNPDVIKIDKKCVMGVKHDREKLDCLQRMVKVCESITDHIIAEGIETQDDLEVVRDLGIQYGQGFLFDRS